MEERASSVWRHVLDYRKYYGGAVTARRRRRSARQATTGLTNKPRRARARPRGFSALTEGRSGRVAATSCFLSVHVPYTWNMWLEGRLAQWAPLTSRWVETAPACCNACRTCTTTNLLALTGVIAALVGGPLLRVRRFVYRPAKPG